MSKSWQPYDKTWKNLCESHASAILTWLGYHPACLREKVRVETLRTESRAPDTVFVLEHEGVKTVLIIECEFHRRSGIESRLLTAVGAALKKFGEVRIAVVVIGLTGTISGGIQQENEHTSLILEYRTIALESIDAATWLETSPSDLWPFVSLMKGCDKALLERTALTILERGPAPDARECLNDLFTSLESNFQRRSS